MKISETKIKFNQKKIESSYITSCSYDVQCIKPGNVNHFSGHHDTAIDDFVKSYEVTSNIISLPDLSLGNRIYKCVERTKEAVNNNTNLGIILLCSVFIQSLLENERYTLSEAIKASVMNSSHQDVTDICDAISLADPGGLSSHETYDVRSRPDISLHEIMSLSADYDQISNQYSKYFSGIFNFIIPSLHNSMNKIKDTKYAISYSFLKIL